MGRTAQGQIVSSLVSPLMMFTYEMTCYLFVNWNIR
jgi:hypothetical protein